MHGLSSRTDEAKRQFEARLEPVRAGHAYWVYRHLVCIEHQLDGPWLVGMLSGLVTLVLSAILVIVTQPASMIGVLALVLVLPGFVTLLCRSMSTRAWYYPRILSCWTKMYEPFRTDRANYRQAVSDIERYDPYIVSRMRHRFPVYRTSL
jgi:hypothetical protein